ncbi:MAG: haloacid dehalogenase-like hydrolase [Alphaproteobacteria bacterium]|nr:haloacid dehalogenase-like hydrolase [Alphaproteobacteria bacterium]
MNEILLNVAICYDFDGTLAPGNMQEYGFMEKLQISPQNFWQKTDSLAKTKGVESNLAYMYQMLKEARLQGQWISREDLVDCGKNIPLYTGVNEWFERINSYALQLGISVEHYLLSSGLEEIVEGMPISKHFKRTYACNFMYEDGVAVWPGQVVNFTTKTQYLFRISKGCLDVGDKSVNDRTKPEDRAIPFKQMLYIGDGITDIPSMATLKKFGGYTAAVYNPNQPHQLLTAQKLLQDKRVDIIAPTDYSDGSAIDKYVKLLLAKLKADFELQNS